MDDDRLWQFLVDSGLAEVASPEEEFVGEDGVARVVLSNGHVLREVPGGFEVEPSS